MDRWVAEVIRPLNPTITESLCLVTPKVTVAHVEKFANLTSEFFQRDAIWYETLCCTNILAPGERVAITPSVEFVFPAHPPGQIIFHHLFEGGASNGAEEGSLVEQITHGNGEWLNSAPTEQMAVEALYHLRYQNQEQDIGSAQLGMAIESNHHNDGIGSSLTAADTVLDIYMQPDFIPTTVFGSDSPVLIPHSIIMGLGLPVDATCNLLNAFQALPEVVQHCFAHPSVISSFKTWAIDATIPKRTSSDHGYA